MLPDVALDRTCLFLDVDGSLIDIAPRPNEVSVPKDLIDDLAVLSSRMQGAVALVSGRSIAQLDALFAPFRFTASGVHGAEWRRAAGDPVEHAPDSAVPRAVWDELTDAIEALPGTFAEDKVFSFAVHYRATPAAGEALEAALSAIVRRHDRHGLRLLPGHYVFEIKGSDFDKGAAVRRFLEAEPFAGRKPIFIGDDVTDYPGFAAAAEAGGWAFAVSADIPGTSGTFASPSAVRKWLADLAASEHVNA